MLFFTACNEESLTDEVFLPATEQGLNCLHHDCATGTNPLVISTSSTTKSGVPLSGIQRAYREQYSDEEHLASLESDGYPAWNALLTVDVSKEYKHYLVPVYKATSNQVEAVISIIHHLEFGMARIDYFDRDDIDGQISYYDSVLASEFQQELGDSKFTKEALSYIHLSLDYELFGYYDTDALNNISQETAQDYSAKDCVITIHYISETVWYTSAGGQVVDVSSTYTFTSETVIYDGVGCGGGTPPGGPGGNPGPGGGGPGNGTNGPGTVVINNNPNDPDNRCIEDGVGCDDVEITPDVTLPPDCESFPYQINTSYTSRITATHLINFHYHHFAVNRDRIEYSYHAHAMDLIYFTAPLSMTNGQAATLTATAITNVNTRLYEVYGHQGWSSSGVNAVEAFIMRELNEAMGIWGGRASLRSNGATGNQIGIYHESWLPSTCN